MSMVKGGTVNLQKELENGYGLRFEICSGMSINFQTGKMKACWQMDVWRMEHTASGRPSVSKKNLVLTLSVDKEKGPAELLRVAALCYEQGEVPIS